MRPGKKGRLAIRVALTVALVVAASFAVLGGVVMRTAETIWAYVPLP